MKKLSVVQILRRSKRIIHGTDRARTKRTGPIEDIFAEAEMYLHRRSSGAVLDHVHAAGQHLLERPQ